MSRTQYSISGIVEYVSDDDGVTGVEHFRMSKYADGGRHLRAYCEMHDDELVRDVSLTVDKEWRPRDAFVQVALNQTFVGSAHYTFAPCYVATQLHPAEGERGWHRHDLESPANGFGSHSVQNDAWFYGAFDRIRADAESVELPNVVVCSRLANGGEAPNYHLTTQRHRYRGEASITTPAGTFVTRHYSFHFDQWPPIHYWVHGDDYLLVQCRWDHLRQSYRLVDLNRPA